MTSGAKQLKGCGAKLTRVCVPRTVNGTGQIRRSENGRLTLGAPYAERLQTQIPTTKSRNDANTSSS